MIQLWRSKRNLAEMYSQDKATNMKVKHFKNKAHRQIAETDQTAKKLNKLLRADGITLKIYIAKGGYSGR